MRQRSSTSAITSRQDAGQQEQQAGEHLAAAVDQAAQQRLLAVQRGDACRARNAMRSLRSSQSPARNEPASQTQTGTPVQRAKRTVTYRSTSGNPSTIASSDETHGGSLAGRGDPGADAAARPRSPRRRWPATLVEARLAACVSVGAPVESIYHWRGEIETAQEVPVADQDARGAVSAGGGGDPRAATPTNFRRSSLSRSRMASPAYLDWIAAETALGVAPRAASSAAGARAGGAGAAAAGGVPAARAQAAAARAGVPLFGARARRRRPSRRASTIADGYYLYRDKLRFAVEPGGPALGAPRCRRARSSTTSSSARSKPIGATLVVRLPLVDGAAGTSRYVLVADSQGCADVGVCYPPQPQQVTAGAARAGRRAGRRRRGAPRARSPGSIERRRSTASAHCQRRPLACAGNTIPRWLLRRRAPGVLALAAGVYFGARRRSTPRRSARTRRRSLGVSLPDLDGREQRLDAVARQGAGRQFLGDLVRAVPRGDARVRQGADGIRRQRPAICRHRRRSGGQSRSNSPRRSSSTTRR